MPHPVKRDIVKIHFGVCKKRLMMKRGHFSWKEKNGTLKTFTVKELSKLSLNVLTTKIKLVQTERNTAVNQNKPEIFLHNVGKGKEAGTTHIDLHSFL
jgi:hypothetical protein